MVYITVYFTAYCLVTTISLVPRLFNSSPFVTYRTVYNKAVGEEGSTTILLPFLLPGRILKRCVEKVCAVLVARKEELNELDRGGGDGDCGNTLKAGADGKREENLATVS